MTRRRRRRGRTRLEDEVGGVDGVVPGEEAGREVVVAVVVDEEHQEGGVFSPRRDLMKISSWDEQELKTCANAFPVLHVYLPF